MIARVRERDLRRGDRVEYRYRLNGERVRQRGRVLRVTRWYVHIAWQSGLSYSRLRRDHEVHDLYRVTR